MLTVNTEWAACVRTMKVEVHPPYRVEECIRDLRALGFSTWAEPNFRWGNGKPPVIATRPS